MTPSWKPIGILVKEMIGECRYCKGNSVTNTSLPLQRMSCFDYNNRYPHFVLGKAAFAHIFNQGSRPKGSAHFCQQWNSSFIPFFCPFVFDNDLKPEAFTESSERVTCSSLCISTNLDKCWNRKTFFVQQNRLYIS